MADVMLALGRYRFSVDKAAYQSLERVARYDWQSQSRVGLAPQQQFVGVGEETINLQGVIFPYYKGGFGQLDAMRAEAALGEALLLVSGLGDVMGKWVITEVGESQESYARFGLPQKMSFRLSIKRYPED